MRVGHIYLYIHVYIVRMSGAFYQMTQQITKRAMAIPLLFPFHPETSVKNHSASRFFPPQTIGKKDIAIFNNELLHINRNLSGASKIEVFMPKCEGSDAGLCHHAPPSAALGLGLVHVYVFSSLLEQLVQLSLFLTCL